MQMMEIIVKLPSECLDQEINEFISLVNEGGEVDPSGLEERVRRAKKLFFPILFAALKTIAVAQGSSFALYSRGPQPRSFCKWK